jgi:DNA polymerase-4
VRVEVWGWDEAFLGARTDDPEALAADLQRAVTAETGLTCAVGVGHNKQQAKLAAGFGKPGGVYRLTGDNWVAVMAERPTDALWGIGRKTARKLADLGYRTVADLAAADPEALAVRFGPTTGPWLRRLAEGRGDTGIVTEPWLARSRSHETTFPDDLTDRAEIDTQVGVLADTVAREVLADGRLVVRVAVKVRFASFFTRTRITTLPAPTTDPGDVARAALAVLDRFDLDRPVRLLGVRVELDRPAQS